MKPLLLLLLASMTLGTPKKNETCEVPMDGKTDATKALQDCIDRVALVPSGVFLITSPIQLTCEFYYNKSGQDRKYCVPAGPQLPIPSELEPK